ncbi:MAG: helix-turn-helix transcriptional regulator [Clostridia bacterium]|nr:helix-turn-helix transcriptional regulator [Clostridia bacterium]
MNQNSIEPEQKIPATVSLQYYDTFYTRECFSLHVQNNLELLLICGGELEVSLNDETFLLSLGDVLICSPFDKHGGWIADGCNEVFYYCVTFDPAFFMPMLPSDAAGRLHDVIGGRTRFRPILRVGDAEAAFMHRQFPHMMRLRRQYGTRSETRLLTCFFSLLCELLEGCLADGGEKINRNFSFMCEVIDYVSAHYKEPLSTASICDALSWSESYFCHRFRDSFGTTFSDYLCRYRVQRAAELRSQPGLTLTDIAGQAGFVDYSYFSQAFSKYMGIPPRRYFWK